jgi:Fic family protein
MSNLENAIRLKQELDALRPLDTMQEKRIWQKFRFDWNYHSNNIEGNSLTFGETKSLLLHNITAQGKPLKDHIEITGHNEAIDAILDFVKGGEPLTESFLRNLHTMMLRERYQVQAITSEGVPTKKWIEVGQYKTLPNHVITKTGETFFFAEPFDVPNKMKTLVDSINLLINPTDAEALIAAAQIHYDFVRIHPFDDGNGRMARMLMNLVLIRHGFPPAVIQTHDKEDYFAALRQADGGQFEFFVDYIVENVAHSLSLMNAGARGENIEGVDEQDKKINMLSRLLDARANPIGTTRSKELLLKFFDESFTPLTLQIDAAAQKFGRFYRRVSTHPNVNGGGTLASSLEVELEIIRGRISEDNQTLMILASFENLMYLDLDSNSYNWQIVVDTLPTSYGFQWISTIPLVIPRNHYGIQLSQVQIQEIVKHHIEHHIQFIENTAGVKLNP